MDGVTYRRLKERVFSVLASQEPEPARFLLRLFAGRRIVNPLFALLYHGNDMIRWRAIATLGMVVADLADSDLESARIVMRRLMWNLNDESGGIGWGSPEAMGDIMARHRRLADAYSHILISYLNPDGNRLEHEGLQQGVLWGIGRLARVRPQLAADAAPFIPPFFSSPLAVLRANALWCALPMADRRILAACESCLTDSSRVSLYSDGKMTDFIVAELAGAIKERVGP